MCLIAALSGVTSTLTFTTGIYIAPVRDLITVAKTVGTAAVLSGNRVRLGVGVGWCEEEYVQTGQDFHTRGKRLNEMIPALRALWGGGWVEYHGEYYDVPACQMNPSPTEPIPFIGGGDSGAAMLTGLDPVRRLGQHRSGHPDEAFSQVASIKDAVKRAGREREPFSIYVAVKAFPDLDLYRRLEEAGVTDLLCAPWMAVQATEGDTPESIHAARLAMCEQFAEHIHRPDELRRLPVGLGQSGGGAGMRPPARPDRRRASDVGAAGWPGGRPTSAAGSRAAPATTKPTTKERSAPSRPWPPGPTSSPVFMKGTISAEAHHQGQQGRPTRPEVPPLQHVDQGLAVDPVPAVPPVDDHHSQERCDPVGGEQQHVLELGRDVAGVEPEDQEVGDHGADRAPRRAA